MINVEEIYIVNYCHVNCEPLKNIMRLPREKAYELAYAMAEANKDVTAFGRFADFAKYYPERFETDRILYEQFTNMGGKPTTEHPLSFVLQGSEMLDNWFDKGIITRIPLYKIPAECISFTYGDSMTTLRHNGKVEMITKDVLLKILEGYPGTLEDFVYKYLLLKHYSDASWAYKDFLKLIGKMCKKALNSKYFLNHKQEDNRMVFVDMQNEHMISEEEREGYRKRYCAFKAFVLNRKDSL